MSLFDELSADLYRSKLRASRKRKRDEDDVDAESRNDCSSKRCKTQQTSWSDKATSGFCEHCTNPYKLIACQKCFRSWHLQCLIQSINRNISIENASTNNSDANININVAINPHNHHHAHAPTSHSSDPSSTSSPTLSPIPTRTPSMSANEYWHLMQQWCHQHQPLLHRLSQSHTDEFRKQILANFVCYECVHATHTCFICKQHQLPSFPLPSSTMAMVSTTSSTTTTTTSTADSDIDIDMESINSSSSKPTTSTTTSVSVMSDAADIDTSSSSSVPQKCSLKTCGRFYHKQCLRNDEHYARHTLFYINGAFKCPAHHCWACYPLKPSKILRACVRRNCWYCPRSFHRQCCPSDAELLSVQTVDSIKTICTKYPAFRFDLITCCWNDSDRPTELRLHPPHPAPKDLQFGRDDSKHGVFKFSLAGGEQLTFYRLSDDPFSIDIKLLNHYKRRHQKQVVPANPDANPDANSDTNTFTDKDKDKKSAWPAGFKRIKYNKYSAAFKLKKCARSADLDLGRCSCVDGCSQDYSCENFGMDIECTDAICGSRDPAQCQNRQWATGVWSNNVEVKLTAATGFGAFANRDLDANELLIEYVGEVISKAEAQTRMQVLNEKKAPNFYLCQVDAKRIIDATHFGNESRFFNHSCAPNCHTVKWLVGGADRLGIFASTNLRKGTELTYDYNYQVENADPAHLAECQCGARNCRFFLGFDKKKAMAWRQKLIAEGKWKEPTSDDDDELHADNEEKDVVMDSVGGDRGVEKAEKPKKERKSKKKSKKKKKRKKKKKQQQQQIDIFEESEKMAIGMDDKENENTSN